MKTNANRRLRSIWNQIGGRWLCLVWASCCLAAPSRAQTILTDWSVSLDKGQTFKPIHVPGTIEDQLDPNFDGVSIYQTQLPSITLRAGQRFSLRFQAVATDVQVYVGEKLVGRHLGGWTPFSVDLTDVVARAATADTVPLLRVVVDEKLGHNTQGFLPIITNHFGGIWQPVTWWVHAAAHINSDALAIRGDLTKNQVDFEVPIIQEEKFVGSISYWVHAVDAKSENANDEWREMNIVQESRSPTADAKSNDGQTTTTVRTTCQFPTTMQAWSPESPQRYHFKVELHGDQIGQAGTRSTPIDTCQKFVGFRKFVADHDRFLLNDHPIILRGVLNWGYAAPSVAPTLDENRMREEIKFAQSRGFNLMKFCLWVPPVRYLELCDELGMLAWMEYPTWHPQLDQQHLADLRQEYREFFEYDRNHACIVLRSLTCETGPSADLTVIQSLYDQCKEFIPQAVVEDDSSWIAWNRVHDFYDDHPYGNNHSWVETLAELKSYIAKHESQPLMLGEAIAADTWTPPKLEAIHFAEQNLAHGAWAVKDNLRWQTDMQVLASERGTQFDPQLLLPQSRHYGMLMRKYQIETFHREIPNGGYVVSVMRDFPKAAMGLIDFENRTKTSIEDWSFQADAMLLLHSEMDRRSFDGGQKIQLTVVAKNMYARAIDAGQLHFELLDPALIVVKQQQIEMNSVDAGTSCRSDWQIDLPIVEQPQRFLIRATWLSPGRRIANQWPVWVFPQSTKPTIAVHSSAEGLARELMLDANPWPGKIDSKSIVLARRFDQPLLEFLANGGKLLLLPDGLAGSFTTTEHWFLRGGPVLFGHGETGLNRPFELFHDGTREQHDLLTELQHFDLAGPVITNIDHFLPLIDPHLVLWDNHDAKTVKTHGLVFEMGVGSGQVLVSALNHSGPTNSAGRWLLEKMCRYLEKTNPSSRLSQDTRLATLNKMTAEINRKELVISEGPWRFKPDPDEVGVQQNWAAPNFNDQPWSLIRVDQHWDGQGFESLDHWAWYRRTIELPADWQSEKTFLNFTGIDDYADIYIDGAKIGTAGNLAERITAFDQRNSFDVSQFVQNKRSLQITVAVFDWYGAGGIFRPVTLSTNPLTANPPILK